MTKITLLLLKPQNQKFRLRYNMLNSDLGETCLKVYSFFMCSDEMI